MPRPTPTPSHRREEIVLPGGKNLLIVAAAILGIVAAAALFGPAISGLQNTATSSNIDQPPVPTPPPAVTPVLTATETPTPTEEVGIKPLPIEGGMPPELKIEYYKDNDPNSFLIKISSSGSGCYNIWILDEKGAEIIGTQVKDGGGASLRAIEFLSPSKIRIKKC